MEQIPLLHPAEKPLTWCGFFRRMVAPVLQPEVFFLAVRREQSWLPAVLHLLALTVWLSAG
jgi:hypothetical protein